jgi:GTP-binding protein HflX
MQYDLIEKRAVLVGVRLPDTKRFEESMRELEGLAEACGVEVVGTAEQNLRRIDSAFYIGKGKVEEIRAAADTLDANMIIFNNTLSPSQLTNLGNALELEIIDRTNLILNIFADRARSGEAKMQVDYAKLKYMLPRLVGLRSNLSRQGGTAGSMSNRGAGEKKIELDRRYIEKRMSLLRKNLNALKKDRITQRKRRERSGIPLVSLVGYTNAGKSTLMNLMLKTFCSDEEKLVAEEDMLFATLDTSVRRIEPNHMKPFLLSDTVGFIDDLPTMLIDAFRSTLDEALNADLILEVVDCSDPEYKEQMRITEQTLADLGAGSIPIIFVMNKADLVPDLKIPQNAHIPAGAGLLTETRPPTLPIVKDDRIWMSARHGTGLTELLQMIDARLNAGSVTCELLIPYAESGLESRLRQAAVIHDCRYEAEGILISATIDAANLPRFEKYRT